MALLIFIILAIAPISVAWWLYFPLAIISIFLFRQIYTSLFTGFLLDIIYFDGHFPILLGAAFLAAIVFFLIEEKLRYHV